jgi:hypothetical protein
MLNENSLKSKALAVECSYDKLQPQRWLKVCGAPKEPAPWQKPSTGSNPVLCIINNRDSTST